MRERYMYLNEREIFVLDNHPAMSYRAIADELGISAERVRQIKIAAEREVRETKWTELATERNKLLVTLTIQRQDLLFILRALEECERNMVQHHADLRRKKNPESEDPDCEKTTELIEIIRGFLFSGENAMSLERYPRLELIQKKSDPKT